MFSTQNSYYPPSAPSYHYTEFNDTYKDTRIYELKDDKETIYHKKIEKFLVSLRIYLNEYHKKNTYERSYIPNDFYKRPSVKTHETHIHNYYDPFLGPSRTQTTIINNNNCNYSDNNNVKQTSSSNDKDNDDKKDNTNDNTKKVVSGIALTGLLVGVTYLFTKDRKQVLRFERMNRYKNECETYINLLFDTEHFLRENEDLKNIKQLLKEYDNKFNELIEKQKHMNRSKSIFTFSIGGTLLGGLIGIQDPWYYYTTITSSVFGLCYMVSTYTWYDDVDDFESLHRKINYFFE